MFSPKFKETLKLMGGRAIIIDGEEQYILMTIGEFKKIKLESVEGLTKQELIDKINNDIAAWKVSQESDQMENINLDELGDVKSEEIEYI